VHIAFDGGSTTVTSDKQSKSACGYIIADAKGREIVRVGLYLGGALTNNECEALGVQKALEHLLLIKKAGGYSVDAPVRVFGDSQLIINFLTGVFKPKRSSLYEAASTTKELARMWGDTVTYTHVIREYNTVADDMVRRARDK
jgi:ribonuclease HI